jgi:hypothetical protein
MAQQRFNVLKKGSVKSLFTRPASMGKEIEAHVENYEFPPSKPGRFPNDSFRIIWYLFEAPFKLGIHIKRVRMDSKPG